MKLKDKVSIVTGSGKGLGKAIAEGFAKQGARVIVAEVDADTGRQTADELVANDAEATFIECNVSVEDQVKEMIATVVEKYGMIDVIINNAGVNMVKPFVETEVADWDKVMSVDLRGTYLCCRYGIIEMLKTGGGSIVNISSVHSVASIPGAGVYDAAKHGMVGLSMALAQEFASRNIRVNVLSPGLVNTKIWHDILAAAPDKDECVKYWKANIPIGRPAEPEEIAAVTAFLASDEASYITGSNILADGGMASQLISAEPYESEVITGE